MRGADAPAVRFQSALRFQVLIDLSPKYRTVLSSLLWPSKSWTALRFLVRLLDQSRLVSCRQIGDYLALSGEFWLRVHASSLFEIAYAAVIFDREEEPFYAPDAGSQLVGGIGQSDLYPRHKQLFRLVRKRQYAIKARATVFHSVEVDLNALFVPFKFMFTHRDRSQKRQTLRQAFGACLEPNEAMA